LKNLLRLAVVSFGEEPFSVEGVVLPKGEWPDVVVADLDESLILITTLIASMIWIVWPWPARQWTPFPAYRWTLQEISQDWQE
jgi:hypothetical protein